MLFRSACTKEAITVTRRPAAGPNENVAIRIGTSASSYLNAGISGYGKLINTRTQEIAVSMASVVMVTLVFFISTKSFYVTLQQYLFLTIQ